MKSIAVGALLASSVSVALAQSPVIFGVLDLAVTELRATGAGSQRLLNGDGNTSSRLGVRGTEDLGGGLRAHFWIEAAINVDNGTGGATSSNNIDSINSGALTWGRRSTIGLQGPWGEVRLGRDYVPTFGNLTTSMHPFGTNGVGSSGLLFYPVNAGGTTVRTSVRASNSLGYHLPSGLGGLYGSAMVAWGEQPSGAANSKNGQYSGVRLGWREGGLNLSGSTGKTRYLTGDYTQSNFGINYKFGAWKAMFLWGQNKVGTTRTEATMIGGTWEQGLHEVRFAYTTLKARNVASDATQVALGYVYDLSKRTALYATVSRVDNKGTGTRFNVGVSPVTPGGTSSGLEWGVRHSF